MQVWEHSTGKEAQVFFTRSFRRALIKKRSASLTKPIWGHALDQY